MAREIQPTPVLEGQEALDFLNKLDNYKEVEVVTQAKSGT